MALTAIRFLLLVLLSLLVGMMYGIWVGYTPSSLSPTSYVEQQQNAIRAFNTLPPAIGGVCIFLTASLAVQLRGEPRTRTLHTTAAILMVVAAVVTRSGTQPINAVDMTWSAQAPAADWTQLRDNLVAVAHRSHRCGHWCTCAHIQGRTDGHTGARLADAA